MRTADFHTDPTPRTTSFSAPGSRTGYAPTVRIVVHDSYARLDAARWDELVGDASPFLEHAFLAALETTGCASPETGWGPQPVILEDDEGNWLGAAPAWVKGHSMGEFVYDHAWADFAARNGLDYYPKLIVGVPFTPVTGPRILLKEGVDGEPLRRALLALSEQTHGLHVLFDTEAESRQFAAEGAFTRLQYQFHWKNEGYQNFDEWLGAFRSKYRKNLRRERKAVAHLDYEIVEKPDSAQLDDLYDFYRMTVDHHFWGRRYLSREFFEELGANWGHRILGIVARDGGRAIAGAFCAIKGDRLYGRYWGAREEVEFLHFEVCYHQTVEIAIERGLGWVEPGHGGGHKYRRGFLPVLTYSNHHLTHPGLHDALRRHTTLECKQVRNQASALRAKSPLKDC
ncbi:MAG: GNAT family N-acetyltransferase [Deltaproteobacteria bacterium]|nr:MAG: GNAT family N-acetyltransferase [Deltaproteobacteria bacterium]